MKTSRALRAHLRTHYKRIPSESPPGTSGSSSRPFIIDDRGERDINPETGWPYYTFHQLTLEVVNRRRVKVMMRGKLPDGGEFGSWLCGAGAIQAGNIIWFNVVQGRHDMLIDAARFISLVVAPGRTYDIPAFKYTCPRTARSFLSLKDVLDQIWGEPKQKPTRSKSALKRSR